MLISEENVICRGVAADAVEPEAGVEDRERRGVAVGRLPLPDLAPVPAVGRALAVAHHEGPVVVLEEVGAELVGGPAGVLPGGRRRELLLDDHGAVGDVAFAPAEDPARGGGGVPDAHGRVRAVVGVVDPGAGVADALVLAPAEFFVGVGAQPIAEERLVGGRVVIVRERARQRQAGFFSGGAAGEMRLGRDDRRSERKDHHHETRDSSHDASSTKLNRKGAE
jgi:hypothetical protein